MNNRCIRRGRWRVLSSGSREVKREENQAVGAEGVGALPSPVRVTGGGKDAEPFVVVTLPPGASLVVAA